MTKDNTPVLRFDKYSQPWRVTKNNHIFVPTDERGFAGLTVLSATQKDGLIPRSLLGKDISYNKDAEKTYKRVLPGDFAIHLRSFQGGFAHSKYEGITSPAYTTFRLRQASQHDDLFWKYLFTSPSFIQSLIKVTYGIRDGRSIGADEYFLEDSCFPPTFEEQRAIGELFSDLDALIEQHRAKHANLQQTKTALLQRMFPQDGADEPELRLGGFNGAWETKKVDEICPLQRGFDLPASKMVEGPVPVVTSNGVVRHHNKALVKGPGVTTGRSGTIGKVHFVEQDYWPHNTSLWVTDFKGNDPRFVYHLLQRIDPSRFSSGSGVPTLNRNDLHDFVSHIPPTLEEQCAIGEVFSNLDDLIAAEQRYITQLTQAKAALLQRMFV